MKLERIFPRVFPIIIILSYIFLSNFASAANDGTIGLMIGIVRSEKGENRSDAIKRIGCSFFLDQMIAFDWLECRIEFRYIGKGLNLGRTVYTDEYGNLLMDIRGKDHYEFLALPVSLKAKIAPKSKLCPNLIFGIGPSYLLRAYYLTHDLVSGRNNKSEVTDVYNRFQMIGLLGCGLEYRLSRISFHLNVSYDSSLKRLLYQDEPGDIRINSLSILTGIGF